MPNDPHASRPLLGADRISEPARRHLAAYKADVVRDAIRAVETHDVVVIGMAQNPHVKNVRKALAGAGVAFHYVEHGSYFAKWGDRLAIKLWSGWPTFPQVFVRGELIGGEDLTKAALEDGSLRAKLAAQKG